MSEARPQGEGAGRLGARVPEGIERPRGQREQVLAWIFWVGIAWIGMLLSV